MKITQDDLLTALREAMAVESPADAPTVSELSAAMGVGVAIIRRFLRAIQAEGRLEVLRVRRNDLAGRSQTHPGYRILPKKKK